MPDAAERKVLMLTTFVSGCITLMPMEWVSAGLLLTASTAMFFAERRIARREEAAQGKPIVVATEADAEAASSANEVAAIAPEAAPSAEEAATIAAEAEAHAAEEAEPHAKSAARSHAS